MSKQITDTILMVRPANFGFNTETADNNVFQQSETQLTRDEIIIKAQEEFDRAAEGLRSLNIDVVIYNDTADPPKTDAVFPNNWFSTHEDGSVFLYPMFSPNRRLERSQELILQLAETHQVRTDDHLLAYESEEKYLEGTGSMILDRVNKVVYACYSQRTHPELLVRYAETIGYKSIGWTSVDENGIPYYHTNVIMALGEKTAIICTESIVSEKKKSEVLQSLRSGGFDLIQISREQVLAFAGNMLAVKNKNGESYMIMSTAAFNSLSDSQIHIIENNNIIAHFDISTIEHFGGGSIRCMMAEIFLPKK